MRLYKMPDGTTRRYPEDKAPACGILVENKPKQAETKEIEVEVKEVTDLKNKAVDKPATKSKKKGGAKK